MGIFLSMLGKYIKIFNVKVKTRMKKKIVYNPPIDVYFEYQFVMNFISEYLGAIDLLSMKPKVSDNNREFLKTLKIVTFEDLINANISAVAKIYENKQLFRFLIEVFSYYYELFECTNETFMETRVISIILNGEQEFLDKPINIYLIPGMYVRMCNVFKNHKKYKIEVSFNKI